MLSNKRFGLVLLAVVFAGGFVLGNLVQPSPVLNAQSSGTVYELRTYTSGPGKLNDLQARFPRPHGPPVRAARHEERRILGAGGCAAFR